MRSVKEQRNTGARAGNEVSERVNKWYSFILHCENSSADATDDTKRMVGKKVIEASRCHVKTCRINVCRTPPPHTHKNTHIYTNILRAANSYVFIIIFILLSATKLLHSVVIYTFTGLVWVQPMIQIPSGLQQEEYLVQNFAKSNMCSYLLG